VTPGEEAKLYVILGSHACRAGKLMLDHKGIPYRAVTLPTGMQRLMPLWRFPDGTVPALAIDGRRVQRNIAIARALDQLKPDPPLFPSDQAQRQRVEEAEYWADDVFQMATRRIGLSIALHPEPARVSDRGGSGRLGPMLWRHDRTRRPAMRMLCRFVFDVNPRTEAELLRELPEQLDRVDAWIGAGVLNGEQLNAADFAIAPCVALLTYRPDLRADIASRPVTAMIDRLLPSPRDGSGPALATT
jgi:glutathione S-transferase